MNENETEWQDYTLRAEEVFNVMSKRVTPQEVELIRKAYAFAAEAHKEQRRQSGEPYITHPIAVARIVAVELELGANPVCAAFLHDVVEDTPHPIEEIRELFGDDVAFLVKVVTKKKGTNYETSKQIDNYRQILDSVHYDVRALMVKLADRLHNMRTLSSKRPEKQMKIAGETDYFYAPLATRLGLYPVKTELENLSFKYRCPKEFQLMQEALDNDRKAMLPGLESFMQRIEKLLELRGMKVRTEIRYRQPYNVWRKMRNSGRDFNHVDGKHYLRIVYDDYKGWPEKDISLYIYSCLTDHFKERPGSLVNYIDAPKENGYQSFHIVLLSPQGTWEEIHISSERMIRHSRLGCIAERNEGDISRWIEKFRGVLQDIAADGRELAFMEGVTSSFYNDDILVFTPQGKGVILPKNATVLDFAFEIHSSLGQHAQFARINGKLSSVKTVLHRGECVEVGANETIEPKWDWLNAVSTYKAKRHLLSVLRHREKLPYDRCPVCHPLPGDEVIGFKQGDKTIIHKRDCVVAIQQASEHGDAIIDVNFEERRNFLYPVRIQVLAVDRFHLLSDLVECITTGQRLSMDAFNIRTSDQIVTCTIDFSVRSAHQLDGVIKSIGQISSVEEVSRIHVQ